MASCGSVSLRSDRMSPATTRASFQAGITTHTRPLGGSAAASVCPSRSVGTARTERSTSVHTSPQTTIVPVAPAPSDWRESPTANAESSTHLPRSAPGRVRSRAVYTRARALLPDNHAVAHDRCPPQPDVASCDAVLAASIRPHVARGVVRPSEMHRCKPGGNNPLARCPGQFAYSVTGV
jgi:hypothetical protein